MIVRRLDRNHDMTMGNGLAAYASGVEAIAQSCKTRLLMLKGEFFLDTEYGVPYLQEIMVKPVNQPLTESIIKQTILDTVGVELLESFSMTFDTETRLATISANVITNAGQASIEVSV